MNADERGLEKKNNIGILRYSPFHNYLRNGFHKIGMHAKGRIHIFAFQKFLK